MLEPPRRCSPCRVPARLHAQPAGHGQAGGRTCVNGSNAMTAQMGRQRGFQGQQFTAWCCPGERLCLGQDPHQLVALSVIDQPLARPSPLQ